MNRFYSNGELFVDLSQVSCVCFESAVIGGVLVKLSESAAFDLRRQVRAYKESSDKKEALEKERVLLSYMGFNDRLIYVVRKTLEEIQAKKILTNNGLDVLESGAATQ